MNRKITILLSLFILGLCVKSNGQAPITGSTDLCTTTTTTLNSTDPGGTWTSANTAVATVDLVGGVVYGAGGGGGTSVITYTSVAGVVTTTVTVHTVPPAITGPADVCEGVTINLANAEAGGTWTSGTPGAATVNLNTGVVGGVSSTPPPGTTIITYTTLCGIAQTLITVHPAIQPIVGTATTVCQGATITLSDPTPGGTWSSNSPNATVTGGVVTGVNIGAVVISYGTVCGTVTYNVTVLQKPGPVTGVSSFCLGSTATLASTPAGGTWSTADPAIASINVSTGVVTTGGLGSVLIQYNLANGCFAPYSIVVNDCPACPINSDFELGNYSQWKYYTGTCCPMTIATVCAIPVAGPPPCSTNRFALTGLAPGAPVVITGNDPYGGFPVVGAGSYSLRIGTCQTNYYAEKARYFVHVPSGTGAYSLIYRYAVVMQDPSHSAAQQPRMTVQAFDVTTAADTNNGGTVLPCANFNYVAGSLPGFVGPVNPGAGGFSCSGGSVYYKPWSTTSINLTGLGGHTIRMDFAAGDCGQGGHFGYGYVDMTCGTFAISSLGCGDSIATVTAPSGFANYSWYDSISLFNPPLGLMGTTQTVTFPMPVVPTTYAVIMTPFVGFGCPDTLYTRIRPSNLQLHPKPDTAVCAGQSANISANATDVALPLSYVWSPGTGLSCTTCANPVVTAFAGVNVYTVVVTDDAGCQKSTTQKVTVDSVAANITNTSTTCFGRSDGTATAVPTSGTAPFTYSWSTVPAQTTSTANNLAVGNYTATINDSKGCTGTATTTITQPPPLTMSIAGTGNPTTCGGVDGSITLAGLVTGASFTVGYLFTPTGAATTQTITTAPIVAVAPGNVVIANLAQGNYDSIKIITTGCPYNSLGPVTLVDPPPPALPYVTSNTPVCIGQSLNLTTTDVTPGVTYSWAGPGGFTDVTQTPVKNPSSFSDSGWYVVTVMVNNCFSKDSTKVVIRDTTHPSASSNTDICSGDTLKFTSFNTAAGNPADYFMWSGPDGFISNFQNPIIIGATANASGVYTVAITYQGCTGMTTTSVTVNQTPGPPAVTDTNFCQNTFAPSYLAPPLTAPGTNLTWYTTAIGGSPLPGAPTPSTQVTGLTTWYVTETTNTTPACTSPRAAITVGIYAQPNPKFIVSDSVFCQGTYFTFEALDVNTGVDYQGLTWSFGPGDSVYNTNPVIHAFNTAAIPNTTIDVTVNVNYYVCADTFLKHTVTIFPYPGLYLGADTSICPGGEALVIGDLGHDNPMATWLWSTGETSSTINVVAPGTYYVKATVNGCSTSDTIIVNNDCYMNMPNVFTPNGDGVNDFFYPRQYLTRGLTSFSMTIYNRWGQEVFTSTSIEGRGWDGKFNDVPQPEGVFIYIVDATFKDGQKEHHQGNVTLLR